MQKKNYKALIFDLDGTLIDSFRDIYSAVDSALKTVGCDALSYDLCHNLIVHGLKKTLDRTLPDDMPPGTEERVIKLFLENYEDNPYRYTSLYEGIEDLLTLCGERDLSLFIYTNKPEHLAHMIVAELFSDRTFRRVFGAVPTRELKPSRPPLNRL
jgi:phosphoglycolate phosphatase